MRKDNFIFHLEFEEDLEGLSDAEIVQIFRAMIAFQKTGEEPEFEDRFLRTIWKPIRRKMAADNDAWERKCEQNRINGALGGAPKGNQNARKNNPNKQTVNKTTQNKRKVEKTTQNNPKQPKQPDNDCEYDCDNDYENDIYISSSDNKLSSEDCRFAKTQKPTPHQLIIENLNELSGRHFAWQGEKGKKNREYINARMKEGYSIEDFLEVNRKKVDEWKDDPQWEQYIRPETLYCRKHFESYLNAPEKRGGFF